ncbi:hypothetical protein M2447_001218 [Ereboglobus sp. PH5-10]|uniref:hypothetical protein n=1 Tax=Ereboglobus sp. PH5-10 TaxID=2940629 RepID=UPI002407247D|nr:hypothetical protein [Ereboglobus sp. PH5-10]MDF9827129.1 hypothetical protein [Ereboglobus sp. PH5-10]
MKSQRLFLCNSAFVTGVSCFMKAIFAKNINMADGSRPHPRFKNIFQARRFVCPFCCCSRGMSFRDVAMRVTERRPEARLRALFFGGWENNG